MIIEKTTMFTHEHVIIMNSGLRDERVHMTGDDAEHYHTRAEAQNRVDHLNSIYNLGLTVYEATEESQSPPPRLRWPEEETP